MRYPHNEEEAHKEREESSDIWAHIRASILAFLLTTLRLAALMLVFVLLLSAILRLTGTKQWFISHVLNPRPSPTRAP